MNQEISLKYNRNFGAEIEINSFDSLSRPIIKGKLPEGSEYIYSFVKSCVKEKTLLHGWRNNHNNDYWAIKPDGSCGLEICTPVLSGFYGIEKICDLIQKMSLDKKIISDTRCSFHVHVDIGDLKKNEIAAIIAWWIKIEFLFFCSIPSHRKKNEYCRLIGLLEDMNANKRISDSNLIKMVGTYKYNSINCIHYFEKKRNTIEFRIMDNRCCLDSFYSKNWIKIILHFINRALHFGKPDNYSWLDPKEAFEFLGFDQNLSDGMKQTRSWFCENLKNHVLDFGNIKSTLFNKEIFDFSKNEIDLLYSKYFIDDNLVDLNTKLYSIKYRY